MGESANGQIPAEAPGGRYKWVALSNTTLGMLSATVNASIVIISLPAIFRGIHLNPLTPGNVSYLLWMLMGYLVVSAVLVVTLGRHSMARHEAPAMVAAIGCAPPMPPRPAVRIQRPAKLPP